MDCFERYNLEQSNLRSIYATQLNQTKVIQYFLILLHLTFINLQFEFSNLIYSYLINLSKNKIQSIIVVKPHLGPFLFNTNFYLINQNLTIFANNYIKEPTSAPSHQPCQLLSPKHYVSRAMDVGDVPLG